MASRSSDKDGDSVHTASEVPLTPRTSSPDRRCSSSDTSKSTHSLTRRISSECLCRDCLGCPGSSKLGGLAAIQSPWIKIPLAGSPGQGKRAGFPRQSAVSPKKDVKDRAVSGEESEWGDSPGDKRTER